MAKAAVIQFPGVNCEYETARALESVGLEATIVRWNAPPSALKDISAVVLPGGFSYQDRIRAGVVAAKDRIVDMVYELCEQGRPVLGICNGAQVLVEAGIVPGFGEGRISLALSPNVMPDREGYYCRWVRVARGSARCIFTELIEEWSDEAKTLPIPVAHAEGRFVTSDESTRERMARGEGIALYYADATGSPADRFPHNPNGSLFSIAGVTNPGGNVLALMPHPERANYLYQVPLAVGGSWAARRRACLPSTAAPGPGRAIFAALERALR